MVNKCPHGILSSKFTKLVLKWVFLMGIITLVYYGFNVIINMESFTLDLINRRSAGRTSAPDDELQMDSRQMGHQESTLKEHEEEQDVNFSYTPSPNQISDHKKITCSTTERARYLQRQCSKEGWSAEEFLPGRLYRNLIVDNKHKLLYCDIPKCGSKSFKHFIGYLNVPKSEYKPGWSVRMGEFFHHTHTKLFSAHTEEEQQRILKEYFKFVVVRHPLDRLRSAWSHKLSSPGKSHILKGLTHLISNFLKDKNPNFTKPFEIGEQTLRFDQFLDLISSMYSSGFINAHWASFYEHCLPCHIPYNHVFKLETLENDMEILYTHLKQLNSTEDTPMISHENNVRKMSSSDKLNQLSGLYNDMDQKVLRKLTDVYERDFALFGYQWNSTEGATCSLRDNSSTCC